jgi:hypothetical protein
MTPTRVNDEKAELDNNIAKLDAFIASERFKTLPCGEQLLLKTQRTMMDAYSRTLDARLKYYGEQ